MKEAVQVSLLMGLAHDGIWRCMLASTSVYHGSLYFETNRLPATILPFSPAVANPRVASAWRGGFGLIKTDLVQ
jgi:hypothetical protein